MNFFLKNCEADMLLSGYNRWFMWKSGSRKLSSKIGSSASCHASTSYCAIYNMKQCICCYNLSCFIPLQALSLYVFTSHLLQLLLACCNWGWLHNRLGARTDRRTDGRTDRQTDRQPEIISSNLSLIGELIKRRQRWKSSPVQGQKDNIWNVKRIWNWSKCEAYI